MLPGWSVRVQQNSSRHSRRARPRNRGHRLPVLAGDLDSGAVGQYRIVASHNSLGPDAISAASPMGRALVGARTGFMRRSRSLTRRRQRALCRWARRRQTLVAIAESEQVARAVEVTQAIGAVA
jgi:hypothetical protein